MADPSEPQLRVVDRRWWARAEGAGEAADRDVRKPTYVEELEQRLAGKDTELRACVNEHRRALDEFEQAKLRIRRDVGKDVERGRRALLTELLEVLDNLDRAILSAQPPEAAGQLLHGVELVRQQFLAKLQAFGVSRLSSAGQPFDPSRHEAVTTMPVADAAQDGTVAAVVKEGYAIGDEMLRPAQVVVGRYADR